MNPSLDLWNRAAESDWVITDVPDLRIVDDDLWEKVRTRQGALKSKGSGVPAWDRRRPRTLFSGLMECGCCGSGFSKVQKDAFGCSAARNKGKAICTNKVTIKQTDLEARVLDALAHHLIDPEAVAAFCEAYTAERNRLAAAAASTRTTLEKELATTKRDHGKLVDAIIAGIPADQVKDKMIALDARRKELEAQLAQTDASPAPVRLHPKMSETYRERVAALIRALAESEGMEEAREAIRGLIEKVVLTPRADGPGLTVDLHGALASLLLLATGAPVQRVARMAAGARNDKSSAGAELEGLDMIDKTVLVAGAGFGLSRTTAVVGGPHYQPAACKL
jgi:hypothetical protein